MFTFPKKPRQVWAPGWGTRTLRHKLISEKLRFTQRATSLLKAVTVRACPGEGVGRHGGGGQTAAAGAAAASLPQEHAPPPGAAEEETCQPEHGAPAQS